MILGNKFLITEEDINFLRALSYKKIKKPQDILVLLESGDEILNYLKSYFILFRMLFRYHIWRQPFFRLALIASLQI
jgi:predicted esterase YcpF (UPF0227 family)